jgi:hypothetical protein
MEAVRMFLQEAGSDIQIVPLEEEGERLRFYFAVTLPTGLGEQLKKAS